MSRGKVVFEGTGCGPERRNPAPHLLPRPGRGGSARDNELPSPSRAAVANALQRELQMRMRRQLKHAAWAALAIAVLWFTAVQIKLSPIALANGIPFMWDFITRLFPPDLSLSAAARRRDGRDRSRSRSGARCLPSSCRSRSAFLGRAQYHARISSCSTSRGCCSTRLRAINELVFALIFVSAVGPRALRRRARRSRCTRPACWRNSAPRKSRASTRARSRRRWRPAPRACR